MPDAADEPPPTPPASVSPTDETALPPQFAEAETGRLSAPVAEAFVVPAPRPPRRRFALTPGSDRRIPAAVWRRHWTGVGGLVLLASCVHALIGGPWPAWRLPSFSTPLPTAGPVAVVVDPGHGGGDTGAVAQGVVEKDLNLDVARRVAGRLAARGVRVRMTREDDHFITLEDRVRTANALPGAVFVSIHFNDASGDGRVAMNRASGIETFYSENKAMAASAGGWMWASLFGAGAKADPGAARDVERWSARAGASLAQSIQGALVGSTAAADRGTKERSLYVTRRVRGPAVLVEGGFVSHPGEARLLGDPAYRQKLADAIADGIVRYLEEATRQPVPAAVAAASVEA